MAINPTARKATMSISVPADQREAFFAALAVLKHHDERLFSSASALIVQAVIAAAQQLTDRDDLLVTVVPTAFDAPLRSRLAQSPLSQEEYGG